jgi:hypothetical protein
MMEDFDFESTVVEFIPAMNDHTAYKQMSPDLWEVQYRSINAEKVEHNKRVRKGTVVEFDVKELAQYLSTETHPLYGKRFTVERKLYSEGREGWAAKLWLHVREA